MLLAKGIICKKCGTEVYKQQAYQYWHNVDCFESFYGITWIKNWWLCNGCIKKANIWPGTRFHDIDGHQYRFTRKFPFIRR